MRVDSKNPPQQGQPSPPFLVLTVISTSARCATDKDAENCCISGRGDHLRYRWVCTRTVFRSQGTILQGRCSPSHLSPPGMLKSMERGGVARPSSDMSAGAVPSGIIFVETGGIPCLMKERSEGS
mmetsp:Transcript_20444/g.31539  ORF Transcript_20444/g.31539 Transcript_20444/m.31539 type:complete len:125 (-) Transcript_20444:290-664(-)|eukprot:CAMPEP_0194294020 /NCGR_PEP_ID=MMETSP0169-20130528/49389_1 /TAXON_ID=218684 /ORGANISM="Corethron pennatum, Strain L29A3" /LENGTH=124 /DNA_ID=CAMNT_0039042737 /DNA_START=11 /DNA_END=385 /DNA_ORIENTATION=+